MNSIKSSTAARGDTIKIGQPTSSSTATITTTTTWSSSDPSGQFTMGHPYAAKKVAVARTDKGTENAVYAHIRAVRALGRTQINTDEIAKALGLSVGEVNSTLASLKKKGVKLGK
jgi:hypothetical protein